MKWNWMEYDGPSWGEGWMDGWMDVSFLTSDEIWNIWDERVGCERIDGSWREREGPIDV